jgi:hypothetical protein
MFKELKKIITVTTITYQTENFSKERNYVKEPNENLNFTIGN